MAFCNVCGSELSEGARFCGKCGAAVAGSAPDRTINRPPRPDIDAVPPLAPPSRGGLSLVLPIVVGIAVLIIAYLLMTGRTREATPGASQETAVASTVTDTGTAAPSVTNRRAVDEASDAADRTLGAPAIVSATALDSAFFSDPRGSAIRYSGPVRVSGIIATMVQPGRTPALSMEGRTRFNYMIVNFPEGYRQRLAPLAKGQLISVTCDTVQGLGGTTILSGCLLP